MGELLQSPAVVFYLGVGAGLALGSVLGAGGNDDALDEAMPGAGERGSDAGGVGELPRVFGIGAFSS